MGSTDITLLDRHTDCVGSTDITLLDIQTVWGQLTLRSWTYIQAVGSTDITLLGIHTDCVGVN